jgi:hypothetical protein
MSSHVLRLWLPDIPGTLGRVAAAIGRAGGDVVGIEILERGAGMAIDELIVELPDSGDGVRGVERLIAEVSGVEGVAVEDVHPVPADRLDQSVLALDVAARIMETPVESRLDAVCRLICEMLESDWTVVVRSGAPRDRAPMAQVGDVPDLPWVLAFIDGTSHLASDTADDHTPSDMAWAALTTTDGRAVAHVVTGRRRGSFRLRERRHVSLIARIVAASLIGPLGASVGTDVPVA